MSYTLIKKDGTKEIKTDSQISEHVSLAEFNRGDSKTVVVFEPIIELFEAIRNHIKRPIVITSGYRSIEQQTMIYNQDLKDHNGKPSGHVAKPSAAPHTYGASMDLKIPEGFSSRNFAALARKISKDIGLPECRTGWQMYLGQGFIHMDLVFMLFEPYSKIKNPCPKSWKPGATW